MLLCRNMAIVMLLLVLKAEAGDNRGSLGADWAHAAQTMNEFHIHLNDYFPMADARLVASAIVFPELIRFHALRDRLETAALKTLYVQYGKQYANFSIGYFQMKPSFAEELEKAWMTSFPGTSIVFDTLQYAKNRLKRVERLSDPRDQILYLYCFYTLMQDRLQGYPNLNLEHKVRLMATAYNRGFSQSLLELEQHCRKPSFHTAIWPNSETPRYCYANIALEYFQQQNKALNNQP
ncbi:MAG: hypothetical protein JXR22_08645 [Prolixibacteraceae bacterium]|nr:hypothetical protein [Prolixibacteraceae bacterium]